MSNNYNSILVTLKELVDGYKYYGKYVNEKTINYVSKYMTKKDEDNPDYISIVLCSKGRGLILSIFYHLIFLHNQPSLTSSDKNEWYSYNLYNVFYVCLGFTYL